MSVPDSPASAKVTFRVDRLASLSDGVFAVAMTLLAYNVHLPHGPLTEGQLLNGLAAALPDVRALVLSFCAAAMFWRGHQNLLRLMRERQRTFLTGTLAFLLGVVFLPITTSLYGTFGARRSVTLIYGGNLTLLALLQLIFRFCLIVGDRKPAGALLRALAPSLYTSAVLLLSVSLSFINGSFAENLWYAAFGGPVIAAFTQKDD